jgi:hypothetical protein
MKEFLKTFLTEYAEKFDYEAIVEGTEGIIRTQYGDIGFDQGTDDELKILKVRPKDGDNLDQASSLVKIKKHFTKALQTAIAENQEKAETVNPGGDSEPTGEPGTPGEPGGEVDNLGRTCPEPSNKPPAHFTKPEKGKKKTKEDLSAPDSVIPGTKAHGDVQRANALGNSPKAMAAAASATIGGKVTEKSKAESVIDAPKAPAPSLDDIMNGKVDPKQVASQPAAPKTVPAQPKAPVIQPSAKQDAVPTPTQTLSPGMFKKAKRQNAKLRLSLSGFSGSGKTVSALLIAYGITKDWSKIAVVDSEGKSAQLYEGATVGTVTIGQYDVMEMEPPFQVERLITAIKMAEVAGYQVLVIDSASPYWQGEGGALEAHSEATKRGGNSFTAWAPVTAKQNRLMDTIIGSKIHIIVTLRSKVEYVMDSSSGRTQVRKIGTESIQRQGFIYDMTMQLDLSQDHVAEVVKDRTNLFDQQHFVPDVEMGEKLKAWLEIEK